LSQVFYERMVRPVLFRVGRGDAERAHEWTLDRLTTVSGRPWALAALRRYFATSAPVDVFGLRFANRVGLAAGMDKNGVALPVWPALGFGFVEVGTVTRHPQPGNERPRMFRLRPSEAVINRMGFNNDGAHALAARLDELGSFSVPLGISLGKSKVTPIAEAVTDYLASLRTLYPYGDYFAVNVSSPNTPGLRSLQDRAQLDELLSALRREAEALAAEAPAAEALTAEALAAPGSSGAKPILVKIAPDLTDAAIVEALEACVAHGVAGVIATNTTLDRSALAPADRVRGHEAGGLSGRPLARRAREVVAFIHRETGGTLPIIGVGGILDPDDAVRMVDAGASLVQVYTGLAYHGPTLVRRSARALR
jgi:dihydroorotate dehydrogenase